MHPNVSSDAFSQVHNHRISLGMPCQFAALLGVPEACCTPALGKEQEKGSERGSLVGQRGRDCLKAVFPNYVVLSGCTSAIACNCCPPNCKAPDSQGTRISEAASQLADTHLACHMSSLMAIGAVMSFSPQDVEEETAISKNPKTWRQLSVLAWPGTLNILSIIVQGMGLQYISASVSQMIAGECCAIAPDPTLSHAGLHLIAEGLLWRS